jgi:hypothetical protein
MRPRKKKRKMSSAVKKYLAALKHARTHYEGEPLSRAHHNMLRKQFGV